MLICLQLLVFVCCIFSSEQVDKPTIEVSNDMSSYEINGDVVTLTCTLQLDESYSYKWMLGTTEISFSEREYTLPNSDGSSAGSYRCAVIVDSVDSEYSDPVSITATVWITAKKDGHMKYPFKDKFWIRTETTGSNDEKIYLLLFDDTDKYITNIILRNTPSGWIYYIDSCTNKEIKFTTEPPTAVNKIWEITLTDTFLNIKCNGEKLLHYVYDNAQLYSCATDVKSQKLVKIKISKGDTETKKFANYSPDFETTPSNVYVDIGKTASFTCRAQSLPGFTLRYSWVVGTGDPKENASVIGEKSIFTIKGDESTDSVSISCNADYYNTNDVSDRTITSSSVLYTGSISTTPPKSFVAAAGEPFTLSCMYSTKLIKTMDINLNWQSEGKAVSINPSLKKTDSLVTSTLIIPNPEEFTEGTDIDCMPASSSSTLPYNPEKISITLHKVLDFTQLLATAVHVISGYSATFTAHIVTPEDYGGYTDVKYEWYLNDAVIEGAESNTYTTPALFVAGGDSNNKYKCKVTWMFRDQSAVSKVSSEGTLDLKDSCEIKHNEIENTEIDNDNRYIENDVIVTITCQKGYILPSGESYTLTCDVSLGPDEKPLTIPSCTEGCHVDNSDTNALSITKTDTESIDGEEASTPYTTIHHSHSFTKHCKSGYVMTPNMVSQTITCTSDTPHIEFLPCILGCKVASETDTAVFTNAANLIAPDTRQSYTCKPNTVTKQGLSEAHSAPCEEGTTDVLTLDECFSPVFPDDYPQVKPSFTSVQIIVLHPVDPEAGTSGKILVNTQHYVCTVYLGGDLVDTITSQDGEQDWVINGLKEDTEYEYVVEAVYSGASWKSPTYQFKTDKYDVEDSDKKNLLLEMPDVDFKYSTYNVIAIWFRDPALNTTTIKIVRSVKREATISTIFPSFKEMKKSLDKSGGDYGAFYAATELKAEEGATTSKINVDDLELGGGETYRLMVEICSEESICVTGPTVPYDTRKSVGRTLAISFSNLILILILVLSLVLILVFIWVMILIFRKQRNKKKSAQAENIYANGAFRHTQEQDSKI